MQRVASINGGGRSQSVFPFFRKLESTHKIMVNYEIVSGQRKRWSDFFRSLEKGDTAVITLENWAQAGVIRASAANSNVRDGHDFHIKVSIDSSNMKATITTE